MSFCKILRKLTWIESETECNVVHPGTLQVWKGYGGESGQGWFSSRVWLMHRNKLEADRPHRAIICIGPLITDTQTNTFSRMSNGSTVRAHTNGRYQVPYLPRFAVDKNSGISFVLHMNLKVEHNSFPSISR